MSTSPSSTRLEASVEENPETGVFRCRRDIFTDPELFELEMKHIWEGNWIYLAHESQIPNNNDYLTGYHRPPADRHLARPQRRAACLPQRLLASRRHDLPPQARQQVDLYLPVPRLDLQQHRQAAEGEGSGRRRLPRDTSTRTARTT